jgi:tetratricopeptide (TPR) repeat protein
MSFCTECGEQIRHTECPNCGTSSEAQWKFCGNCGGSLTEFASGDTTVSGAVQEIQESRQVTATQATEHLPLVPDQLTKLQDEVSTDIWMENLFREGVERSRKSGDDARLAEALYNYSCSLRHLGYFSKAARHFDETYKIFRTLGDNSNLAKARYWHGRTLIDLGDFDKAATHLGESAELFRKLGDDTNLEITRYWMDKATAVYEVDSGGPCPHCGHINGAGRRLCFRCSAPLGQPQPRAKIAPTPATAAASEISRDNSPAAFKDPAPSPQPPPTSNSRSSAFYALWVSVGIGVLLFLTGTSALLDAVVGALIWFLICWGALALIRKVVST